MTDQGTAVPAGDPPLICVYGDTGLGKTLDVLLAFPDCYILRLPGATMGARKFVGDAIFAHMQANSAECTDLRQVAPFLAQIQAGNIAPKPVLIDDATLMSDSSLQWLDSTYSVRDTFKKWGHYDALVQEIRAGARQAGVPVLFTAHRRMPKTDEYGGTVKGGPELGGKRAMGRFLAVIDACYGVVPDTDQWPHPVSYLCRSNDPQMEYKDRVAQLKGLAPLNLREILLSVGSSFVAPRFPGLEWLDGIAEEVAQRVTGGRTPQAVYAEVNTDLLGQGVYPGHAYWALRDGLCRAALRTRGDLFAQIAHDAATHHPSPTNSAPGGLAGALITPA